MSSTKQAEFSTVPGVQLQIASDFSSGGGAQVVTDPTGTASALQLSETAAIIAGGAQMGIGISPSYPLHVGLNDSVRFELGSNAQFSVGGTGVVNVDAVNHPGARFTIQNNGNVGIGQASPQYTLDVTGTIHATAGMFVQGLIPTSKAPSGASLVQLYVDSNSGEMYYLG